MNEPWFTTVEVNWLPREGDVDGGWWACVRWSAGRFMKAGMVEGEISNRYPASLKVALDQVMAQVERFGIEVPQNTDVKLYALSDGDDPNVMLPEGWKDKLRREAACRGWESYEVEQKQGEEDV